VNADGTDFFRRRDEGRSSMKMEQITLEEGGECRWSRFL
jgi:hypothetical protein